MSKALASFPGAKGGSCPRKPRRSGSLYFLDGVRGLTAFYVMFGHARWLLWEGYTTGFLRHPSDYGVLGRLGVYFTGLFKFGHEAVLLFFVLSGFSIHLRYARRFAAGDAQSAGFGLSSFLWRRARRLYPPLLTAFLLSLIFDGIGIRAGYPIYGQQTPYAVINQNVVPHLEFPTLIGNCLFLMETYVPPFGVNGPLWSLKYEGWFYLLYPLFWWLSSKSIKAATGVMSVLFLTATFLGHWPVVLLQQIFSSMLIWWFGVILADLYAGRIRLPWTRVIAGFVALAGLSWVGSPRLGIVAVGAAMAALLASGLKFEQENVALGWLERLKPLGDMSYTLYVTHFSILTLLSGWLMARSQEHTLPRHFGWMLAGIVLTLGVAYALHFVIERPFSSRSQAKLALPSLQREQEPDVA